MRWEALPDFVLSPLEAEGWRAFWTGYGLSASASGNAWARGWCMAQARAYGQGVKAKCWDLAQGGESANPYGDAYGPREAWGAGYEEADAL